MGRWRQTWKSSQLVTPAARQLKKQKIFNKHEKGLRLAVRVRGATAAAFARFAAPMPQPDAGN
jgi:hypothetical protein